ncbi:MAG TPA: pilus assembly protein PilM [Peptococcaceae bacterium]|nr:pilus assembly protein PilM [Peptococcaceae bacterium]
MKKQWLAVLTMQNITVAKIAVGKSQKMKILFLAEYRFREDEKGEAQSLTPEEFAAIKNWLTRQRVPLRKLKLALSSSGLITRVISLPQMAAEDLEKLVTNNIDQYFTINVQNYIIDYRLLRKYRDGEKPMMDVLLAAFPKDRMQNILSLCEYLSFEPAVIDLTADCLARLYSSIVAGNTYKDDNKAESAPFAADLAIVSMHADRVEFVLLEKGLFFLYSEQEFACREVLEQLKNYVRGEPLELQEKEEISPEVKTALTALAEEEEIKLYLSSYLEDEVELFSAEEASQDVPLLKNDQGEEYRSEEEYRPEEKYKPNEEDLSEEEYLSEEKYRPESEATLESSDASSFQERDRYLDEIINSLQSEELKKLLEPTGSEADSELGTKNLDNLMEIKTWNSDNYLEYLPEEDYAQQSDLLRVKTEENQESQQEQDALEEELLRLDDDIFTELTKTLPQLDFSLPMEKPTYEGKESQESQEGWLSVNVQSEQRDAPKPADEPDPLEQLDRSQENFRSAALNINYIKSDSEEFTLEDLFVPKEKLKHNLVIDVPQQELEVSQNNPDLSKELEHHGDGQRDSSSDTLDIDKTLLSLTGDKAFQQTGNLQEQLESCLEPVLTTLAELLSFFAARHYGSGVSAIYLTGDYCTFPYLAEVLAESLGVKTIVGFPEGWKPEVVAKGKVESLEWQRYGSLFGLALRED